MKNVGPQDYALISDLVQRLGIQIEDRSDLPDNKSVIDDLTEAIEEIKMAEAEQIKLQSARDLINEL